MAAWLNLQSYGIFNNTTAIIYWSAIVFEKKNFSPESKVHYKFISMAPCTAKGLLKREGLLH